MAQAEQEAGLPEAGTIPEPNMNDVLMAESATLPVVHDALGQDLILQLREQSLRNKLANWRRDDSWLQTRQVLKGSVQGAGLATCEVPKDLQSW